jgi:hypothetical protein
MVAEAGADGLGLDLRREWELALPDWRWELCLRRLSEWD